MRKLPRLTAATLAVLDVLSRARADDPVWGLRICRETDLGPGTVYPVLERLATLGWLTSTWEPQDTAADRPRRRFYELNGHGRTELATALAARAGRRRWNPAARHLAGGLT
ncbi:PadR family transcriptional regulator [Cryptosporangium sp. NPDC051539]|uniref:PadR family transcriptional regulator n=1 Tax=Cryptosporangium sp. NPDC051539 TaxID=3363962 RepID=UPI0037A92E23